jgi:hypothetical protein
VGRGFSRRAPEREIDRVYVNGDCALARLRGDSERWQVLMTEEAFQHLMFGTLADGAL